MVFAFNPLPKIILRELLRWELLTPYAEIVHFSLLPQLNSFFLFLAQISRSLELY